MDHYAEPVQEHATLPQHSEDDGRAPLALAAGLAAGLVAGGLWAAVVLVTDYELGIVAWGIGVLVGAAMARVTMVRSNGLAAAAGACALLGLVAGKVLMGSTGALAEQYANDPGILESVHAWQLYEQRELSVATLEELDALGQGDTLPDALWERMRAEAGVRLSAATRAEREEVAGYAARRVVRQLGIVGAVRAQFSLFDVLWLLLAVSTAFRMMAPAKGGQPASLQPA
jgi:hypothetical protein